MGVGCRRTVEAAAGRAEEGARACPVPCRLPSLPGGASHAHACRRRRRARSPPTSVCPQVRMQAAGRLPDGHPRKYTSSLSAYRTIISTGERQGRGLAGWLAGGALEGCLRAAGVGCFAAAAAAAAGNEAAAADVACPSAPPGAAPLPRRGRAGAVDGAGAQRRAQRDHQRRRAGLVRPDQGDAAQVRGSRACFSFLRSAGSA